jgi:pentalenene oxygenase
MHGSLQKPFIARAARFIWREARVVERPWKVVEAPGALPVIGHAWKLRKGLLPFLLSLPAHGDLVAIRLGPWRGYVVCHQDLVHQILLDDRTFDRGGRLYDAARDLLGDGLGTCPRSAHRRQRRLVQPAFHRARIASYARVMSNQIEALIGSWPSDSVIDVPAQMHTLTGQVVARTVFAGGAADRAAAVVAECVPDLAAGLYQSMIVPDSLRSLTPSQHRFNRARRRVHDAVDAAVRAYRQSPARQEGLLAVLMATPGDSDEPLSDREIRDQVVTLLVTGIEAAASALSWALHALSAQPELQHRLQQEADAVLAGRIGTWEDLEHLPLTGRVISETLRFYSPA